jgi:hypothetical protein
MVSIVFMVNSFEMKRPSIQTHVTLRSKADSQRIQVGEGVETETRTGDLDELSSVHLAAADALRLDTR